MSNKKLGNIMFALFIALCAGILSIVLWIQISIRNEILYQVSFDMDSARRVVGLIQSKSLVPNSNDTVYLNNAFGSIALSDLVTVTDDGQGGAFIYFPSVAARNGARGHVYTTKKQLATGDVIRVVGEFADVASPSIKSESYILLRVVSPLKEPGWWYVRSIRLTDDNQIEEH
jgi:hypothetical protein